MEVIRMAFEKGYRFNYNNCGFTFDDISNVFI